MDFGISRFDAALTKSNFQRPDGMDRLTTPLSNRARRDFRQKARLRPNYDPLRTPFASGYAPGKNEAGATQGYRNDGSFGPHNFPCQTSREELAHKEILVRKLQGELNEFKETSQ
jgi:hypothetical protein